MSDRMIVEDPQGRIVSVPSHAIPRGSRIIRPDVLPGQSSNTAKTNTSDVVNPVEDEIIVTIDGSMENEDGERVNADGEVLGEDGKPITPEAAAESNPDSETDQPSGEEEEVMNVSAVIRLNLLPNCMENLTGIAHMELVRIMNATREVEMEYAPVATGSLRDSTTVIMTGDTSGIVRVGGGSRRGTGEPIDYAIFQEYGTIYNAAHPFVRPAADFAAREIMTMRDISSDLIS